MGDWFHIVEHSHYRRSALLAEADQTRRAAVAGDTGIRATMAALLIKAALWLAPSPSHRAATIDERVLPRIARI